MCSPVEVALCFVESSNLDQDGEVRHLDSTDGRLTSRQSIDIFTRSN
jgi:hypothetical protein